MEYFDFYLMHAQSVEIFEKFKLCLSLLHGRCEADCPQHLPIRDLLVDVANEFEQAGLA